MEVVSSGGLLPPSRTTNAEATFDFGALPNRYLGIHITDVKKRSG